ncbi:MAG: TetR/AcrR family transcriptional regulator [Vicingaceae bacterium]|nr:TetR/AcrR family transcriptional regulator [Vicingaceae bacterium]
MERLLSKISIQVNSSIYIKDPETSDLGKKIITVGIDMLDELGYENFTFRKLAKAIKSTEASIYRYFESKHKLLLYLTSWYWSWTEYKLVFRLTNIESAEERLEKSILLLTEEVKEDGNFSHINEVKLNKIVIAESSKVYLCKDVDAENKEGVFSGYKQIVQRVSDIILEINPAYKYPHMLVSTVVEGGHHQRFFSEHLPKLTDKVKGEDAITCFYRHLTFRAIENK